MKHRSRSPKQRKHPKIRLRLPDLEFSKTAVLNSLTSVEGQRGYGRAIDEFVDWYCSEPRLTLNRTVLLRYRSYLEARLLAPGTINLRLGAKRREMICLTHLWHMNNSDSFLPQTAMTSTPFSFSSATIFKDTPISVMTIFTSVAGQMSAGLTIPSLLESATTTTSLA